MREGGLGAHHALLPPSAAECARPPSGSANGAGGTTRGREGGGSVKHGDSPSGEWAGPAARCKALWWGGTISVMGGKGGCVLLPLATWRGAGMGLLRGGTSEGAASCGGQGARAAAATFLMFSVLKMPCAGLKCLREVSFGSDNTELCKKKKKRK